ncbi:GerAB/ArcD/ProY family transporter [Paenibacillus mendelii]|uniref:Endospore germination permease n=1 Tax=Paenibacillus mendelii TaxID=206163 RepID=A0ABV6J4E9_9BACL|nr:endospore germination permease [Paenibacillus mendelii]MCQ6561724.1 endospore germination permease [Paenibacillus mendelii]
MEQARISSWQFFLLTFMYVLGTTFFLRPGGLIAVARQDAWMIWLWTGAIGVAMAYLWMKLAAYYPGLSIVQVCTKAGGKLAGGFIAMCYIGFFVQLASWVVRNLGDFMKSTLMPHTPITVFHVMILAVVCYATVKGLESIARTNEMLTPIILLTFIIICFLMLPEWNTDRFQPAFRLEVWKTMKETRNVIAFPYIESIVLMMMFPYVKSRQKASFVWGMTIATLILVAVTAFTVGVLGVTRASHETYPLYVIVQEIRIGSLIEHLEASITVILLVAIFIKLSTTFYCAVTGICQLFQLTDRTWVAVPLTLIVSGLSLSNENVVENISWDKRYVFEYELIFGLFFPLLLLVLAWLRKRRVQH